jgi:DNA processing protein
MASRVKGEEVKRFGILGKAAPKEIFVLGKWEEKLFENSVAVVGSRKMSEYGMRVTERIVTSLVAEGRTVISGFMYGVDMTAHEMVTKLGGRTVAVLGWGIGERLENREQRLVEEIVTNGGIVISEWEKQKGALWTFPARNRIVAALCDELIVVEAAEKSGALITAEMAIKYKKPVWAVPGPVTSRVSQGTNKLISDGKARIYLTPNPSPASVEGHDSELLNLLANEVMDASEIARKLGKPVAEVASELTMLVLSGQVKEREGKYYAS